MALEVTPSRDRAVPALALGGSPASAGPIPGVAPARLTAAPRLAFRSASAEADRNLLDGNAVRSVDRAAALLLALGECAREVGVTELARRLGLHKSTASRLLATLQRRGLVEQDEETGKYRLGLVVIRLAEHAERTLDLKGLALPELERLARTTRETVTLGVVQDDAFLTLAQVDGPAMAASPDWTGRTTPLHCVAPGKVLLAAMPERDVMRIARPGLTARTGRTITSLEALMEELARVRRRGFAMAFSEWAEGMNGLAVPVVDARGRVIASIGVRGPAHRVTPARVAEIVTSARATATAVTTRLGGTAA
jgi:DNA-binding IclR family transcriptional regulator